MSILNFKIALRNIWRSKTTSFINIIGLAIGLAACLMLLIYVNYEWNFDKHSKYSTEVHVAMTHITDDLGKDIATFDGTPTALASTIAAGIPEVKHVARISYDRELLIANGENSFKATAKFGDPEILNIYDYHFLQGDPKTALKNPGSIILTASMAKTLFGSTEVLNQPVRLQDQVSFKVTGIIKDLPGNSSHRFDYLLPWKDYKLVDPSSDNLNWDNYSFVTLVRLAADADLSQVNEKLNTLILKQTDWKKSPFFFYPLERLHLYGKFVNGKSVGGDISQIWLFTGLAFGILLIACINFMNMATAKSEKRAKEVGIKKTIGATRASLVAQFLTESIVLTFISVFIAVALVEAFLPAFGNLLNIQFEVSFFNHQTWIIIAGMVLFTGLIAGSYPALYLSSFNPIQIFKRKIQSRQYFSFSLRQVLIVGQFCFAVMLIVSTLVIYKQIQFIKNKPVGIDIDALVEMPFEGAMASRFDLLKTQLLNSGAVSSVAKTTTGLIHHGQNFNNLEWPGMAPAESGIMFNGVGTSYDFTKTSGLKLLQGRDFTEKYASDTAAVLISSSAAKIMNLDEPLGTTLKLNNRKANVIGVFEDYAWDSPYNSNNPMIVFFSNYAEHITMRLNPEKNLQESVKTIERITKEINPAYPVELNFVSSSFEKLLQKEKTLGILSNLFGGLAIFVSCIGLFGLVTFSAEQRSKEFGVRKVLGASVGNLMQLLSVSFLKLIVVAIFIAVPISYYVMNNWLHRYEFRTDFSWWIIPLSALGTLTIALLTLSVQAYKTAKANPVDALKYE
ncbi:ABC transporter permease [Pedobacter sp. SAFR-022]|uniref:ABC transporter permease n=1 Tax=Pedobacter sp. SAFR-022 TaxID=3436861 RepID=UPI003F7FAD47